MPQPQALTVLKISQQTSLNTYNTSESAKVLKDSITYVEQAPKQQTTGQSPSFREVCKTCI